MFNRSLDRHATQLQSHKYTNLNDFVDIKINQIKSNSLFCMAAICWIDKNKIQLECGPMPNLMVALPNIGGALCSTPQSFADAHY